MTLKRFVSLALVFAVTYTSTFAYSKFDLIMDLAEAYGLELQEEDILRNYFNKILEDNPEYFDAIVNDILSSQDKYSMYLPAEEYQEGFQLVPDTYVGIGISFSKTAKGMEISLSFKDGPAYQAGIRSGDIIVAIDGVAVGNKTANDVSAMLFGEEGTSINIKYRTNGIEKTCTVHRKKVSKSNVENDTIAKGVEYIRVTNMGSEQDSQKFQDIWMSLPQKETASVILDLRGNTGGLVTMALDMLNTMIPDEDKIYMGIRNRKDSGGFQMYTSEGIGPKLNKIVVLIDGNTASAAEMVAGSISDLGYATLLGTKTYGKGVGQVHIQLTDGSYVVVTSIEMFLPERANYNGIGLTPNLTIENSTVKNDLSYLKDMQTNKTLYYGQSSISIHGLNQRLSCLGYKTYNTNYYSTLTQQAVREFQRDNGLTIKDSCDSATLYKIQEKITELSNSVVTNDIQLQTAIEICKTEAQKPLQYTLNEDGSFTNN